MANTYSQITFHLVFVVKSHENCLSKQVRQELFRYISGIINNKNCKSLAVGGYTDHVHILAGVPASMSASELARIVKSSSSKWINDNKLIPGKFERQEGFGGFSCSKAHRDVLIKYIMNQEEHHSKKTFKDEYLELLKENDIDYDEKYLFDFLE
jgi:putative transposase